MLRNPIRKSFRRRRRDLEELKGGPWWRVGRATEEQEGAALEEGTEEFYDSRKEQRRRLAEQPSRRPRRRDAIRSDPPRFWRSVAATADWRKPENGHNGKAGGRKGHYRIYSIIWLEGKRM
ncbi:hypothetical protein NDU88_001716 [Pleurodeles waltl]|uniref:Uncharacterized protein n=1 Tax=Pleurodeles waltl TaxID=8319 RepID=A0AAV7LZE6_PLEWA|nr:hypothetical protein NDU88_001716 [Pleurodeles waltl]